MTGFDSKQQMAADKLQEPWNKDEWRKNNWQCGHGWLRGEQCEICNAPQSAQDVDYWIREATAARQAEMALRRELETQPAQEPVAWQCREHGDIEWLECSKESYGTNPQRWVYRKLYTAPPQPAQEPVNLLEARRIAAEYGIPNSQIDSGNLYFALSKCLEHIDAQPAQEPAFKWRSVFQEMPTENSHILFCFGVHIVEGSFTTNEWASLAYGTAQPDFWAYFPPPPHHKRNQELYTAPPQRQWIWLSDADIRETIDSICQYSGGYDEFLCKKIEQKVKELNI